MISYKMDVLERQSLTEVNMGRGSSICERVHKTIVEYFKNNIPQCQIKSKRLSKSLHLQYITSSKDSEKLEKSLCVRDKAEDIRRHCITHRHDSVIDITKWAQEYFQKPLLENTICRAICRCQLKLYHAKRKPYVNMVQKHRHVLWAKAHLKWTVSRWKSDLFSDESKFEIFVENQGRRVLRAKEEGDLPECY